MSLPSLCYLFMKLWLYDMIVLFLFLHWSLFHPDLQKEGWEMRWLDLPLHWHKLKVDDKRKNGDSKLLGWKKQMEKSKLFQPIFWDSFLDKKKVDLHTQAFHFLLYSYNFTVKFDICDLVIICSEVHIHNLNPFFCLAALYSEVTVNNISVGFWFFFLSSPL